MNYIYFKNYLIYFLTIFFILIILYNIYHCNLKEGLKVKKIGKTISKGAGNVIDKTKEAAEAAAEQARRQAEAAAAEARRQAEAAAEQARRQAEAAAAAAKKLAEEAAAEAKRLAEEAAAEAKRLAEKLAEELAIQKALAKLIEPVINLKNTLINSLNFLKEF
jgi:preprotein translocase subunit SecF